MIARCYEHRDRSYSAYGGRGITVCEEWRSFDTFAKDMGERPSIAHTLDRKDNDGAYTHKNCRWATKTEQANNRRTNIIIASHGMEMTMAQWNRHFGLSESAIRVLALSKGVTPQEIVDIRMRKLEAA